MNKVKTSEKNRLEEDFLLEAIYKCYGYDFREYTRDFLSRRLQHCLELYKFKRLSEFIPRILYEEDFFSGFLANLLVSVTEMFRDPSFFLEIKQKVIPVLKTYPFIKIWHAGCATGQEVYSMAILLEEAGLLNRTTIYATDINLPALKLAREGIYPLEEMKKYEKNYLDAGGAHSLTKYYYSKYEYGKINDSLKSKIIFFKHDLVNDDIFSEDIHGVCCRNVYIYFNKDLQLKTSLLFYQSLIHKGFLCLGNVETLDSNAMGMKFEAISKKEKIFKKSGNSIEGYSKRLDFLPTKSLTRL